MHVMLAVLLSTSMTPAADSIPVVPPVESVQVEGHHAFAFSGNLSIDQSSGRILVMVFSRHELDREAEKQPLLRPFPKLAAEVDAKWSTKLRQPVNVMTVYVYNDIDCPGAASIAQGSPVSIIRSGRVIRSLAGLDRPVYVTPGHVGIAFAVFPNVAEFLDTDQVNVDFKP